MKRVVIVLGSNSDREKFDKSEMTEILDAAGVSWQLAIVSAHRNLEDLTAFCANMTQEGTQIFIAAAGMAAALPGTLAALTSATMPILGVALSSSTNSHYTQASELAQTCMPAGRPVAFCGHDSSGFKNAAVVACQILSINDKDLRHRFGDYMRMQNASPIFNAASSKESEHE